MLSPTTLLHQRYRLEELLGQGGMGAVYRATDQHTDQVVAVKYLRGDAPRLRAAFEREAHLLSRLSHPALPRVSDAFVDDGGDFLVMTFVPGQDLGQQLVQRTAPFPPQTVLDWADQLLDVLSYLHTRQPPIVHRDVKPRNVKLDATGRAMLLDFGLARDAADTSLSLGGYTLAYAPLEQVRRQGLEPRSDLYALGATLFELLARRRPPDAPGRAAHVADGSADPLSVGHVLEATVPAAVSAVITQALALVPSQRPATARAMRAALREAIDGPPTVLAPAQSQAQALASDAAGRVARPHGTVTFLATEIVGSGGEEAALARHDTVVRRAMDAQAGFVFGSTGSGLSVAFATADRALAAALATQRALLADRAQARREGASSVRIALLTGTAELVGDEYVSPHLPRLRRLVATGHAGQILVGAATYELLADRLPIGVSLRDLGTHRLAELPRPERVYQVTTTDLLAEFPPLASREVRASSVPLVATPFIGRAAELAELVAQLRHPSVRLITLTGTGGVGKTRLAVQAAEALLDDFQDGVAFVPLAGVRDPALVVTAIAYAMGVREQASQSVRDILLDDLRTTQRLLVLDNFEHLLAAGPLIAELLTATQVKLLVTSRGPLDLDGEIERRVPQLESADAVALFVHHARTVHADLALDGETAAAVDGICARLDRLPLAIELAAARMRFFTPPAFLTRLQSEQRLALLSVGSAERPARQQSLRTTMAWSHQLLTPAAQQLFARLSVFVDGCDLDAAESVCATPDDTGLGVATGLADLAAASLLRRDPGVGGVRYDMLETVREYAAERLAAAPDRNTIRARHADHFVRRAEAADAELGGPRMAAWLAGLAADLANIRAALEFFSQHDPASGLQLAGALWRFWQVQGHLSEGRGWLERLLGGGAREPTPMLARALIGAGALAWRQQDLTAARRRLRQATDVCRVVDQPVHLATALKHLGLIALKAEPVEFDAARRFFEESLALRRALHDADGTASCLNDLAVLAHERGEYARAIELLTESLSLCRASGNPYGPSFVLNNLSLVALAQGTYTAAAGWLRESLTLARELNSQEGIGCSLCGLASLAAARGQATTAARLFGAAEALQASLGVTLSPAERATYERHLLLARSRLDADAWEAAASAGRAEPLDQLLDAALAELSAP